VERIFSGGKMSRANKIRSAVVQGLKVVLLLGASLALLAGCARVAAEIDRANPAERIETQVGETVTLSVTFTNTGNRAREFIARAVVLDTDEAVVRSYEQKLGQPLEPGEEATVEWDHEPRAAGEYHLAFDVWRDGETLLDQLTHTAEARLIVQDEEPEDEDEEIAEAIFEDGDRVRVTDSGLRVRVGPGLDESRVASPHYDGGLAAGTTGRVVDGPVEADGHIWWRIDYAIGVVGWSVQEFLEHVDGNG